MSRALTIDDYEVEVELWPHSFFVWRLTDDLQIKSHHVDLVDGTCELPKCERQRFHPFTDCVHIKAARAYRDRHLSAASPKETPENGDTIRPVDHDRSPVASVSETDRTDLGGGGSGAESRGEARRPVACPFAARRYATTFDHSLQADCDKDTLIAWLDATVPGVAGKVRLSNCWEGPGYLLPTLIIPLSMDPAELAMLEAVLGVEEEPGVLRVLEGAAAWKEFVR